MEIVRRGGGGSDLVVPGSLSLGPFHSEMDEELTSCLRLRVADPLQVCVCKASGAWLPRIGCHQGCRGPKRSRVCPRVLPGGGLRLFPERRDCYLMDGRELGAASSLDMCAWLEFLFSSLFLFCL